jgi:predicted dehydrogenase
MQYAKLAMDCGKHVLVEKPAAASVAEMEELKRHAALCGVSCMPVHNCTYYAALIQSSALVAGSRRRLFAL